LGRHSQHEPGNLKHVRLAHERGLGRLDVENLRTKHVRIPYVIENRCSGCGFCEHHCPVKACRPLSWRPWGPCGWKPDPIAGMGVGPVSSWN
jgi:NAD-dependent dihydropyrimidine dehydrogenase PreA subunit